MRARGCNTTGDILQWWARQRATGRGKPCDPRGFKMPPTWTQGNGPRAKRLRTRHPNGYVPWERFAFRPVFKLIDPLPLAHKQFIWEHGLHVYRRLTPRERATLTPIHLTLGDLDL